MLLIVKVMLRLRSELDVFEYGYDLDDLFVSKMCDELYVLVLQLAQMNCEYQEDEFVISSDETCMGCI